MLLQSRPMEISIPDSSTCMIRTLGLIKDGDTVSIVSPIFSSVDFQTGSIVTTETFEVPIHVDNEDREIESDGSLKGMLHCFDNDIFHMHVHIH